MSPERMAHFEEVLLQLRLRLAEAEARGRGAQGIVELDQQSIGRLARMEALLSQAMAQPNGRHRATQSARIDAALGRIDNGTFGECLDCGDGIPIRRLELDPTSPLCITCASGWSGMSSP